MMSTHVSTVMASAVAAAAQNRRRSTFWTGFVWRGQRFGHAPMGRISWLTELLT